MSLVISCNCVTNAAYMWKVCYSLRATPERNSSDSCVQHDKETPANTGRPSRALLSGPLTPCPERKRLRGDLPSGVYWRWPILKVVKLRRSVPSSKLSCLNMVTLVSLWDRSAGPPSWRSPTCTCCCADLQATLKLQTTSQLYR